MKLMLLSVPNIVLFVPKFSGKVPSCPKRVVGESFDEFSCTRARKKYQLPGTGKCAVKGAR